MDFVAARRGFAVAACGRLVVAVGQGIVAGGQGLAGDPVTGGALSPAGVVASLGMALATARRGLVVGQRRGVVDSGVGLPAVVVLVGLLVHLSRKRVGDGKRRT